MNSKSLRHSANKTQNKDHGIGTYDIKKILLSWFDDKIYTQNSGCDEFALAY